jgi:S-DNA-T family DNA segregation ATPase FtsK/SpoIIIE
VQGCYVTERETDDLVSYLKTQEEASYTMLPVDNSSGYGDGDDFEDDGASDELYEPCVRWVVNQGEASTSSLQRKFKIGYTRAARIVDTMEAKGIVGPMDGVKRREVMLDPENLELFFRGKGQGIVEGMND